MAKFKDFEDLEEYVDDDDYEYDYDDGYDSSNEYEENEYVDEVRDDFDNDTSYEYYDDSLELDTSYEEDADEYDNYDSLKFDDNNKIDLITILNICSSWFIKLGIIIAVCLVITFFVTGKVFLAFAYIFGLLVAFSVGYVFMYCVDHILVR